jgi:hypothetical protein
LSLRLSRPLPFIVVAAAYWPGLLFFDSQGYLATARTTSWIPDRTWLSDPTHPLGYGLVLKSISWGRGSPRPRDDPSASRGLAVGALVYALCIRLGVRRLLATVAAGLVLLDGYAVVLEQFVLAEALFTLFVVLALYLVAVHPERRAALGASALLAAACLLRPVGLFVVPVFFLYLASERPGATVGALSRSP